MNDLKIKGTIEVLPIIILMLPSVFDNTSYQSALMAGIGFLCLALTFLYYVFRGNKYLEVKFQNNWRAPYFLLSLLIILFLVFAGSLSENKDQIIFFGIITLITDLIYLYFINKIFSHANGAPAKFKDFSGSSAKLLLISALGVFLISALAFAYVLYF